MTNKFLAWATDKRWCYLLKTNGGRENRFVGCGITRSVWDFLSSRSFVSHPTCKVKWDVENLSLESSPLNQQQWAWGWPESAPTVHRCKQPPWTVVWWNRKSRAGKQGNRGSFSPLPVFRCWIHSNFSTTHNGAIVYNVHSNTGVGFQL